METRLAGTAVRSTAFFNVTKWFKRGELQSELAEATAAAGALDPLDPRSFPLEVADDPVLTELDERRLALQAGDGVEGPTETGPIRFRGTRMSDREIFAETAGPREARFIFALGLILTAVVGAVSLLVFDERAASSAPPGRPGPGPPGR